MRRLTAAVAALVLLLPAGAAVAAGPAGTQSEDLAGCVRDGGGSGCQTGRALDGGGSPAMSPDGRFLYVPASSSKAVAVLTRDPGSGRLTQSANATGCTGDDPSAVTPACADGRNLAGVRAIALSPNGRVAVAAGQSGVATFVRDTATGALFQAGCVSMNGQSSDAPGGSEECGNGRVISMATAVVVSPDGRFAYVARPGGSGDAANNAVSILTLDDEGAVSQVGCIRPVGLGTAVAGGADDAPGSPTCSAVPVAQLGAPQDLQLSPDGTTLYVAMTTGVLALTRNASNGSLAFASCVTSAAVTGCTNGRALASTVDLALSPDGRQLYAAGSASGAVAVVDVDGGTLSQAATARGCIAETASVPDSEGSPCSVGRALKNVTDVSASPDGRSVLASGLGTSGFDPQAAVLDRASDGALTQAADARGCLSLNGVATGASGVTCGTAQISGTVGVAFAPDGQHVYPIGVSAVGFQRREVAPTCTDQSGNGALVTITFACTDLNGDPVTLALAGAPSIGSVTVDAAARTATFRAPCGTTGSGVFRVTPSDGANVGPAVTGTVAVPLVPCVNRAAPAALLKKSLRVDAKGRVKLVVTCPKTAGARCAGRVTVTTKAKRYAVLSGAFDLAPGAKRAITAKPSAKVKRALAGAKKGKLPLTATLAVPATPTLAAQTVASKLTLKAR